MAIVVYLELLCILYRDKGYYIEYNDDTRDDVIWTITNDILTGKYEPDADTIRRLIDRLVACRLFSHDLYQRGFITSHRAQEQYYRMTSKRSDARVNYDIWLLNADEMKEISPSNSIYLNFISASETRVPASETAVYDSESTYNKEKENNVEESLLDYCKGKDISLRSLIERFKERFGTVPDVGVLSVAKKRQQEGLSEEMLADAIEIAHRNLLKKPGADVQAYVCGVIKNYAPPACVIQTPEKDKPLHPLDLEYFEQVREYQRQQQAVQDTPQKSKRRIGM